MYTPWPLLMCIEDTYAVKNVRSYQIIFLIYPTLFTASDWIIVGLFRLEWDGRYSVK